MVGRAGLLILCACAGCGPGLFTDGTSVSVGTFNGGLLFYNRTTGKGKTGYLDANATWFPTARADFGAGWTHVVGAGTRGVLFYKATTGKGVGGFLSAAGVWTKTTTYG